MRFVSRVLAVDDAVADEWEILVSRREAAGRPIAAMDVLNAATAVVHGLTLITRNVTDFRPSLDAILNPWLS